MTIVSEIEIIPIKPQKGVVAFTNFIVDGKLFLGSIAIHSKLDGSGYRITYPQKNSFDLCHPINQETSKEIEDAVISQFKKVMKIKNDRYNSNFNTSR